jgi:hypothetical protein
VTKPTRAEFYRKLARDCLEVAERMSFVSDRERLTEMASNYIEMAARAEDEEHRREE